jgi:ankyrin repeat protein
LSAYVGNLDVSLLRAYYHNAFGLSQANAALAAFRGVWLVEDAYTWAIPGQLDPLADALLGHRPLAQVQASLKAEAPLPDSALFLAVEYPEALKLLLAQKPDMAVTTPIGKTALMEAAKYNQSESVKLLLAAGADVNASSLSPGEIQNNSQPWNGEVCGGIYNITHGQRTALMYAAANANLPVIKALLAAGADKHAKDSTGATALNYLKGIGTMGGNKVLSAADFNTAEILLAQ